MNHLWNNIIFIQSISIVLSLSMIIFFLFRSKKTHLLLSYISCQALIFVWSTGQILVFSAQNNNTMRISMIYEYTAVIFVSLSWLMFCLHYTYNRLLIRKWFIILLFTPPVLMFIALLTNHFHHLFFSSFEIGHVVFGPLFWAHAAISYIYLTAGIVILIKSSINHLGYARNQSIVLIIASLIPFAANIIYLANRTFKLNILNTKYDITPISFSLTLLFFAIATFKYRFLNIVPIAFRKIVHNLNESIVVVDSLNKIDNYNKSFEITFSNNGQIKTYDNINKFIRTLKDNIIYTPETENLIRSIKSETQTNATGELTILAPVKKCFQVNIQPIFGSKHEYLGRIVIFNDITEYKNLLDEVNEKNVELSAMNEQLSEYAETVEELAITKERNRFARDVHDTLGHTMTLLISLLEVSSIMCKQDPAKTEEKLSEALKAARDGLKELRRSIKGLEPEKLESEDIISSIEKMIEDFKPSGMNIDFSYDGFNSFSSPTYSKVIFRVCQEALTNSLRHGKAKHVNIILRLADSKIKIFIFDDGCGSTDIKKGFGLSGMEQRVKDLNGDIVFGSDGESGFNIRLEIPINSL
uniref:sensor histidine kinase n=1 Tax=Acetivibrio cellulolyticus TaxID=35830 RepID=UPI0001E2D43D|nr:histidine kinase N-terminal 7TM domain-containing protein [Acetivibrio cellulolyticus]